MIHGLHRRKTFESTDEHVISWMSSRHLVQLSAREMLGSKFQVRGFYSQMPLAVLRFRASRSQKLPFVQSGCCCLRVVEVERAYRARKTDSIGIRAVVVVGFSRQHPIHGKAFPTLIERLESYISCLPGRSKGQRLSRNGLNPVGGIASPRDKSRHVQGCLLNLRPLVLVQQRFAHLPHWELPSQHNRAIKKRLQRQVVMNTL